MTDRRPIGACLHAAYGPADPDRKPPKKSRNIREAIERMGQEADDLKEAVSRHPPFCGTIQTIGRNMK